MMEIGRLLELPNEMLEHIATFVDSKSLALLGQTCKALHNISNIDTIWQLLCQADYGVSSNKGWDLSFKDIYTKILCPYPILGFQRLALQPFGGLVHIVWAEGEISVSRLFSGWASTTDDLVREAAYSLTWNNDSDGVEIKCTHSSNGPAPARIAKEGSYFVLQCSKKDCHFSHRISSHSLGQSDKRVPEGFKDHPGAFKSFDFSDGYSCPLLPLEFHHTPTPHTFAITPGLYRGDYGSHGSEIIQFRVNESNPNVMEGLKITGDPNVPAGNVSVFVYLDKPIIVTEEEQMDVAEIFEADDQRPAQAYLDLLQNNTEQNSWRQPLVLPHSFYADEPDMPSICFARYLGQGRIAGHNFTNPRLCRIHVVKFDNDTVGVLWLELSCFMMMHREKQLFS